jgi:hypothetical protein
MKSILIEQIQLIPGVTMVEPYHISPEKENELLCIVTFEPELISDRLSPEEVQRRNYNANVRRGKITNQTTKLEFVEKCEEELNGLKTAIINNDEENEKEERADVVHVMEAMSYHYAHDLQLSKEKKMIYNELRK